MPFYSISSRPVTSAGYPSGLMRLEYVSGADGALDDALLLPSRDDRWVVCIHGFGGKSTQLFMRTDIKRAWLPCYLERGLGIAAPTLRGNSWMRPESVQDMDDLLEYLRSEYGARRFYFCSGSLGGTSNLIYAGLRPENVSGVISHAAACEMSEYYEYCLEGAGREAMLADVAASIREAFGGTPAESPEAYRSRSTIYMVEQLQDIPICLLHGDADELMPVSQSRRFAAAMGASRCFRYLEIPGGNHNAAIGVSEGYSHETDSPLAWILR